MNWEWSGDILSLAQCLNPTPRCVELREWIMHSWKAEKFLVQGTHLHCCSLRMPIPLLGWPQETGHQPFVTGSPEGGTRLTSLRCFRAFQRKLTHLSEADSLHSLSVDNIESKILLWEQLLRFLLLPLSFISFTVKSHVYKFIETMHLPLPGS